MMYFLSLFAGIGGKNHYRRNKMKAISMCGVIFRLPVFDRWRYGEEVYAKGK
jgi:hypothetical protein